MTAGLLFCCYAIAIPVASVSADESTTRYFEELRRRRLFSLAEGHCLSRLADDEQTLEQRTLLTVELARTFSEHARYTSGREQAQLWQRSREVIDKLLQDAPGNPRRVLLETQRALASAVEGKHLRWQMELFPYDPQLRQRAVAAFDDALPRLRELEKNVAEQLRRAKVRRGDKTDALSAYQLRSLSYHLRHQIGQALIEQATLDAAGSADRVALSIEAESWLEPLAKGDPQQRLTLECRIELAEASRLRGDRKKAADVLNSMEKEQPPRDLVDRLTAVKARLLLDVDRATDAVQLLAGYRTKRLHLPGELQFLNIKALAALWKVAEGHQQQELSRELMQQIEAHTKRAETDVGGFWGYRCRLLLESTRESARYGSALAGSVRKSRMLYIAGRADEAAAEYGRAFEKAVSAEKPSIAMELGYTRASILLSSKKYEQAGDAFGQLAARFPSSPQAASAHLLGAYCLGKLYEQRPTKSRRERYTDALVEHRAKFPKQATTTEATWMLARLQERRLQITRALALYLEIPGDHTRGPAAQVAVARCYEKIFDRLRELGRPLDEWEHDALVRLGRITARFPSSAEVLSIEQSEVCLRFARIFLNRSRPDYKKAGQLLDRVETTWQKKRQEALNSGRGGPPGDQWQALYRAATQLRIVALAGRGSFQKAEMLIRELSETDSDDVLSILDGLSELTADAEESTRRSLGDLGLRAAEDLQERRAQLDPAQQKRLDHCLAQAYVATGQSAKAIKVYESLLAGSQKDRRLIKTVAELLVECATPNCFRAAKKRWRSLESLEKPGGPAWMNARYHVALCAWSLKEFDECRKLLAITRLLYPKLGGGNLRDRFEALDEKLKSRR